MDAKESRLIRVILGATRGDPGRTMELIAHMAVRKDEFKDKTLREKRTLLIQFARRRLDGEVDLSPEEIQLKQQLLSGLESLPGRRGKIS